MTRPLDELAALNGIALSYYQIGGHEKVVPDGTKRALLAAMGVAVEGDEAVARALDQARTALYRRPLEPVMVVQDGVDVMVPLAIPAESQGTVRWRVTFEEGGDRPGERGIDTLLCIGGAEVDGVAFVRVELPVGREMPLGYHRLEVEGDGLERTAAMALIVTPERCLTPEEMAPGRRLWGVACQLYGLRGGRGWGVGDLSDLADLAERAAAEQADTVGVSPLHALFPTEPDRACPYAPSSRFFLDARYIDLEAVPEFATPDVRAILAKPEVEAALESARTAELVDYAAVMTAKRRVLEAMFELFARDELDGGTPRGAAFVNFRRTRGELLVRHALFDALDDQFAQAGRRRGWRDWPEAFRRPDTEEVRAFAAEHHARITFFSWLQWLLDLQLGAAQERALAAGMTIGLYHDYAVGDEPSGAAVWGGPDLFAGRVSVGSPPDPFSPAGQNWGLAPLVPSRMRAEAYASWLEGLRSVMRHAGAVRIDHAMGMTRLFWIPEGASGEAGSYVRYPLDDLLGLLALESHRERCLIVAEDLGTVPDGFRERLDQAGILSYRVLLFEREDDVFKRPHAYPDNALVTPSTHDLPTIAGFFEGRDVAWRQRLGILDAAQTEEAAKLRRDELRALLVLLDEEGFPAHETQPGRPPDDDLVVALHRLVARTPSRLLLVQLEDMLGFEEQANLPGTVDDHPNWRRRLPVPIDEIFTQPRARAVLDAIRRER